MAQISGIRNLPVELDMDTFVGEVVDSSLPVLVDLWSPTCAPCMALSPTIDQLAAEFSGRAKIAKLDISQAPNIAQEYDIRGVPAVMFFHNREYVRSIVGNQPKKTYVSILDGLLAKRDGGQIDDELAADPESLEALISSSDVDTLRDIFLRNPKRATQPLRGDVTPLSYELRRFPDPEKVELLLSYEPALSIHDFAGLGRRDELEAIIANQPELADQRASDGYTPLFLAIQNSHVECVRCLLDAGADASKTVVAHREEAMSPLALAAVLRNVEIGRLLLERGASHETSGLPIDGTLMHFAVTHQDGEFVKLLIEYGFDLEATDENGDTPFEAAESRIEKMSADPRFREKPELAEAAQQQLSAIRELKFRFTAPQA